MDPEDEDDYENNRCSFILTPFGIVYLALLLIFAVGAILLSVGATVCYDPKNINYSCPQEIFCSNPSSTTEVFYGPCGGHAKDNSYDQTCSKYCSTYSTLTCARITTSCDGSSIISDCVRADRYCNKTKTAGKAMTAGIVMGAFSVVFSCFLCMDGRACMEQQRVAATNNFEDLENHRYTSSQQSSSLPTMINYSSTHGSPPVRAPSSSNSVNHRFDDVPASREDDLQTYTISSHRSSRADRSRGLGEVPSRHNSTIPSSSATTNTTPAISVANRESVTNSQSQSRRIENSSSRSSNPPLPSSSTGLSSSSRNSPYHGSNRPIATRTESNNHHNNPYHPQPTTTIVVVAEAVMSGDDHSHENIPIVEAIPLL